VRRTARLLGLGAAALLVAALVPTSAEAAGHGASGRHAQRVCTTTGKADVAVCHAEVMVSDSNDLVPMAAAPPGSALTPAQVRDAYNLETASSGGRTVAIVDAYGYPNLERDLGVYRSQFGLSPCTTANGCLRVIDQNGGTNLPKFNVGWAGETALDVDAVSAACPDCKILVVQAKTASVTNLGKAVSTAARQPGVVAISNSYGGGDLADSTYGTYYNHPGIAITASTGDSGYQGASYPASSAYVTAVGGTSLVPAGNTSRGWSESVWSGAGSGCSTRNAALAAAASWNTGCARRASADVSAAADPAHGGLAVYWPTSRRASTWAQVGGTSESAPIIAAVYAMSGNTAGYANAIPYGNAGALFDITTGSNGSCPTTQWCTARTGWDGPTGLGTPNGTAGF
jgi:subtilase family serine protease